MVENNLSVILIGYGGALINNHNFFACLLKRGAVKVCLAVHKGGLLWGRFCVD